MIIIDKTPYRSPNGQPSPIGQIQGMLKYGMSWQARLKAQDLVIAILEKQLDSNFALLRNVILPNTEILLPLVLVGPPGVFLLNVAHERGVYQARDDEWGTMIGDRFVPARINQITRTATLGRVLQTYLDRQGFKGAVVVEPILMASDPGMQIESMRPTVRVVMSDALERFAASTSHARPMIDTRLGKDLLKAIVVGKQPATTTTEETFVEAQPREEAHAPIADAFSFKEDDEIDDSPIDLRGPNNRSQAQQPVEENPQPKEKSPKKTRKKRGPLGLTTSQWIIVIVSLLFAICIIAAVIITLVLTLPNA